MADNDYLNPPMDEDEKAFDDALKIINGEKPVGDAGIKVEDADAGATVLPQNGNPPPAPVGVSKTETTTQVDGADNAQPTQGETDNSDWIDSILNDADGKPDGLKGNAVGDDGKAVPAPRGADEIAKTAPAQGVDKDDIVAAVMEELKTDPNLKDDFEIFGDDYRKQGKVAEAIVRKMLGKLNLDRINATADHLEEMERARVHNDWERQVDEAVPGWKDIINRDSRFPEWFDRQSSRTKDCLRTASTAEDAIFALQKFQFDVGQRGSTMENMRSVYGNPANERNTTRFTGNDNREKTESELFDDAVNAVYKGRPRG